MLTIKRTRKFKQDFRRILQQGYNVAELLDVVEKLAKDEQLPEKYNDWESQ